MSWCDTLRALLPLPSVRLRSTTVPVGDDIFHIADENRVVREIEEVGLLAQLPDPPTWFFRRARS